MSIRLLGSFFCLMIFMYTNADPLVRSIHNKTPFQFMIVTHNDISDCSISALDKPMVIEPYSHYKEELLLGSDKPGIVLRPSGFYDKKHKVMYSFLDKKNDIDRKKLTVAFHAWKTSCGKKYKKSLEVWFSQWLCGDISLIHNHVEVFGYLLNVSIARIDNEYNYHACMIDYSEGLFSHQLIDITIDQSFHKGIIPYVKSSVGQGGFCQDGAIVRI